MYNCLLYLQKKKKKLQKNFSDHDVTYEASWQDGEGQRLN